MDHHHAATMHQLDLNILALLTGEDLPHDEHDYVPVLPRPTLGKISRVQDRRPVGMQDPLMIAAAASAGPDITRNHYLHEFFPHTLAYTSCDEEGFVPAPPTSHVYESRQAPRRERLALEQEQLKLDSQRNGSHLPVPTSSLSPTTQISATSSPKRRRLSVSDPETAKILRHSSSPAFQPLQSIPSLSTTSTLPATLPELVVQCQVRTRIPTPHGHIFLHLYKNNHDDKEHLAFVADHAQMEAGVGESGSPSLPFIRSSSLDAVWREGESEMERIVRGAYVGKLSASTIHPSIPSPSTSSAISDEIESEPPLVRIHSECFTGETIGSQRCDCGEQLDEAFRIISETGRGIVVYLRQEGRGIGLLEKMRAYNLQDLGHDTVTANLLLGHGADQRTYDIAGAILRDLEVPEVRLLTNNPDKIEKIEQEGIAVVERVAMVPRAWTAPPPVGGGRRGTRKTSRPRLSGAGLLALAEEQMMASPALSSSDGENEYEDDDDDFLSEDSDADHQLRRAGVGMIGASITRSAELDKYLKTKIERMGHMLSLPPTPPSSRSDSPVLARNRRAAPKKSSHQEHHPLASSIVSLSAETDDGSFVECGSGCEACEEEKY